jgi:hypothetical protein
LGHWPREELLVLMTRKAASSSTPIVEYGIGDGWVCEQRTTRLIGVFNTYGSTIDISITSGACDVSGVYIYIEEFGPFQSYGY